MMKQIRLSITDHIANRTPKGMLYELQIKNNGRFILRMMSLLLLVTTEPVWSQQSWGNEVITVSRLSHGPTLSKFTRLSVLCGNNSDEKEEATTAVKTDNKPRNLKA